MTANLRKWQFRVLVDGNVRTEFFVCGFRVLSTRYERSDTALIELIAARKIIVTDLFASLSERSRREVILQVRDLHPMGENWRTLFHGVIDGFSYGDDPLSVLIECRDYLSFLLDARLLSTWSNHTALEVAKEAVLSAGLECDLEENMQDGESDLYCGQFWQLEHKRLSALTQHRYQTAFDLVFSITRDYGLECYASGRKIRIQKPRSVESKDIRVFSATNLSRKNIRYQLGMATSAVVGIQSWDSRQRARSKVYFDGVNYSETAPETREQLYTFRVPGRRMDDIRRLARGKHQRIVSHALEARVSMPAIVDIAPRHFMILEGAHFTSPKTLAIDSVHHVFDQQHGYQQDIVLRERSF